jgi:L-threonylcarbamoyladenylate synthase
MEKHVRQAVSILKEGGVVAYPTDTVYGLGADAFNEEAVRRIYRVKQRPLDQPLSILIADKSDLVQISDALPETARLLAERFWPGGLTLVLRKLPSVPHWITAGGSTVAVRIPDHPVTLDLIRSLGKPLIGTSANLSGLPSVTSAEEVRAQLGDAVDFILDGGICSGGIESTVVDVTGKVTVILREGAVSRIAIAEIPGISFGEVNTNR